MADAGRTPHPFGCLSCCVLNMLHATWKSGFTGLGGREALEQMPSNSVWNTSKSQDMPSTMPYTPAIRSDQAAAPSPLAHVQRLFHRVGCGSHSSSNRLRFSPLIIRNRFHQVEWGLPPSLFPPTITGNRFHQVECGKSSSLNCIRGGFEVEGGTYPALNLNSGRIRVECRISCG